MSDDLIAAWSEYRDKAADMEEHWRGKVREFDAKPGQDAFNDADKANAREKERQKLWAQVSVYAAEKEHWAGYVMRARVKAPVAHWSEPNQQEQTEVIDF